MERKIRAWARWRLASALSSAAAGRARAGLAERPWFSPFASGAATAVAAAAEYFLSRSPEQQQRMLNRMETWEHLTPGQKADVRQLFGRMQQLPPDRRRMVSTAIRDLRGMPPGQRKGIIDSVVFKVCSHPRSATSCAEPPGCRWRLRRMEDRKNKFRFLVHPSMEIMRNSFRFRDEQRHTRSAFTEITLS